MDVRSSCRLWARRERPSSWWSCGQAHPVVLQTTLFSLGLPAPRLMLPLNNNTPSPPAPTARGPGRPSSPLGSSSVAAFGPGEGLLRFHGTPPGPAQGSPEPSLAEGPGEQGAGPSAGRICHLLLLAPLRPSPRPDMCCCRLGSSYQARPREDDSEVGFGRTTGGQLVFADTAHFGFQEIPLK